MTSWCDNLNYVVKESVMKPADALITEMTSSFERFLSKFEDIGKVPKNEGIKEGTTNKGAFVFSADPQNSSLYHQEELKRALSKVGLSMTDYEETEYVLDIQSLRFCWTFFILRYLTVIKNADNNALNHGDTRDGGDEHDLEDVGKLFHEPNSSDREQKTTVDLVDVKESDEFNMMTGEICKISADAIKNAEDSHNTDNCKTHAEERIELVTKKKWAMYSNILENNKKWEVEYQSLGTSSTTGQRWWNIPTTVDCTDVKEGQNIHKETGVELYESPQDLGGQFESEKAEVDKRLKEIEEARAVEEERLKRIQKLSTEAFQSRVCHSARLLTMDFETFQSRIQFTKTLERERSRSADPLLECTHMETHFNQNVDTESMYENHSPPELLIIELTSAFLSSTVPENFSRVVKTARDEKCIPNLSTTSLKQQCETPNFQPNAQTVSTDRNTVHTKHERKPLTKQQEGDVGNAEDFVSSNQKNIINEQTKTVGQSEDRPHSRQCLSNTPWYAV
ncbi:hypothetical protein EG68_07466 [Paragonimus skrjabini miyazakii]|uniref:Uncharacterized protein n=1 Tax=Paragonimus skrjabini miyazakii TaxID=59628 RepID=A0A8S9YA82_9TREM|nr:hypothetical protein EG68_07466 [Paragonimus skrjabini miyazakii]